MNNSIQMVVVSKSFVTMTTLLATATTYSRLLSMTTNLGIFKPDQGFADRQHDTDPHMETAAGHWLINETATPETLTSCVIIVQLQHVLPLGQIWYLDEKHQKYKDICAYKQFVTSADGQSL